MGWLKDALGFEASHVSDLWAGIKKDPKRLVLGVDPLSTAGWNAVLGRQDEPLVNQVGGPTEQNYQNAENRGIDTGAGRTLHGIAGAVAGAYGGQAAGGALNWAGGGSGAGGNWAQYARLGQGAMSGGPSTPAPISGPPPMNGGPRGGMPSSAGPSMSVGPQPVMDEGMRRRTMIAQLLRGR